MTDVNERVASELELIPRGSPEQNDFRALYEVKRLRALGAKSNRYLAPHQVIEKATATIRETVSGFEPEYDPALLDLP